MLVKSLHIVCTRNLEEVYRLEAQQRNINLESHDFLKIQPKAPEAIQSCLGTVPYPIVFTSQHAVQALAALDAKTKGLLLGRSCFCVEGTTAQLAEKNGFSVAGTAPDAARLASVIIAANHPAVLHCTSANRRQELFEILSTNNILVHTCEVYEKQLSPVKVGDFDGIVVYSPSQVDSFLLKNRLPENTPAFCIGKTTAAHLQSLGHKAIIIAAKSSTECLLQTVYLHFNKST